MNDESPESDLLWLLITPLMKDHPRPWRIEQDWTWEVYDASGGLVLKCMSPVEASLLCDLVKKYDADEKEFNRWMTGQLGEGWDG